MIIALLFNGKEIFALDNDINAEAVHLTVIYNIFVLMQLFNAISSRHVCSKKVNNVFTGLFNSYQVPIYLMLIAILNFSLIQYSGYDLAKLTPLSYL